MTDKQMQLNIGSGKRTNKRKKGMTMREFKDALMEAWKHEGLVTPMQAARILGVTSGRISQLISADRIDVIEWCGLRMCSGKSIADLLEEKIEAEQQGKKIAPRHGRVPA